MDQGAAPEADADELSASAPAKRRKLAVSLFVSLLCDVDRDLRQAQPKPWAAWATTVPIRRSCGPWAIPTRACVALWNWP